MPEVTGFTLCHTKEGKTTTDPFGLISLHNRGWFEPLSVFLKSNSKSPPSYSVSSDKLTVTDNFLDQLNDINASNQELEIAEQILGNLDDHGYLNIEPINGNKDWAIERKKKYVRL